MSMSTALLLACMGMGVATKLADMEQGAKFEKCITIADWEGKTLADDITLQDRDANGCCPTGTVPGVRHYSKYVGAQVVCGFKSDGTVATSSSTSDGVETCTYNQCYIWKQNIACSSGVQRLNGCCAAKADCTGSACGFKEACKHYAYNNPGNSDAQYCLSYNKDYKMEYTSAKDDDQADDKLQTDKVYQYTACAGGAGDDAGATATTVVTTAAPEASCAQLVPLGVASILLATLTSMMNA